MKQRWVDPTMDRVIERIDHLQAEAARERLARDARSVSKVEVSVSERGNRLALPRAIGNRLAAVGARAAGDPGGDRAALDADCCTTNAA